MCRRIRLNCAGRTTGEVLDRLVQEVVNPEKDRHLVLIVEDVQRIEGSLTQLLKKLVLFVNDRGIRASLVDPSGCAATLCDAMGGSVHLEVCKTEDEVTKPKYILLVEDTEDSLDFVRTLLEAAGHRVDTAKTGLEAVRLALLRPYDLILLDLVLPDLNGLQVAEAIGGVRVPIIAMSAYFDRWEEKDYLRAGFRHRLNKPFKVAELLAALR